MRWLLTRPHPLNAPLAEALRLAGDACWEHPLLAIEPLPADAQRLLIQTSTAWDRVIFTSQASVDYSLELLKTLQRSKPQPAYYAVGQATVDRLAGEGLTAGAGQDNGSESLLEAMLPLPSEQRILLITGQGGRQLIDDVLKRNGHHLTRCEVYRRQSLVDTSLDRLVQEHSIDTVLITSAQALSALTQSLDRATREHLQLVVMSKRIADIASELDYARVVISNDLRAEALRLAIE
ncbi:MAG: uroporphyrinogen-III synthase [Pseudomonadales bacterium]|jgi:uroporphyrinogen-III synthase